jgi:hypothetical protein
MWSKSRMVWGGHAEFTKHGARAASWAAWTSPNLNPPVTWGTEHTTRRIVHWNLLHRPSQGQLSETLPHWGQGTCWAVSCTWFNEMISLVSAKTLIYSKVIASGAPMRRGCVGRGLWSTKIVLEVDTRLCGNVTRFWPLLLLRRVKTDST